MKEMNRRDIIKIVLTGVGFSLVKPVEASQNNQIKPTTDPFSLFYPDAIHPSLSDIRKQKIISFVYEGKIVLEKSINGKLTFDGYQPINIWDRKYNLQIWSDSTMSRFNRSGIYAWIDTIDLKRNNMYSCVGSSESIGTSFDSPFSFTCEEMKEVIDRFSKFYFGDFALPKSPFSNRSI